METIELLRVGRSVAMSFTRGIAPEDAGAPYEGLSVCSYTADSPERVAEARRRVASRLCLPPERLIIPRQTHSLNVLTLHSLPVDPSMLEGVDGIVTRLTDVALCINTADCVPVVMADSRGTIGIAHAGWRGMAGGIVELTIGAMLELGARADEIVVSCGPHISAEAFEVGPEVAQRFVADGAVVTPASPSARPHVSLYAALRSRSLRAGIAPDNIRPLAPEMCSYSCPERFFSARRLGIESGRTPTLILTRSEGHPE